MFETIAELLEFRARTHPDRIAFRFGETRVSYGDHHLGLRRVAGGLAALGLERGSRFAVLDLNTPAVFELVSGAALLGAVPILVNWRLAPHEIDFVLSDAGVEVLFFGASFEKAVEALSGEGLRARIEMGRQYEAWRDGRVESFRPRVPPTKDDVVIQLYTSGTTGRPKGVCTTNHNLLSLFSTLLAEIPGFGADAMNLVAAPMYHVAGVAYAWLGLYCGATNVVVPVFDPRAVAGAISRERITHTLLVPAMQQAVLALPDLAERDFSSLRHILYGASPMPESLLRRSMAAFGCRFSQAFGLTETSGLLTLLRWDDHAAGVAPGADGRLRRRLASAGKPVAGVEVQVTRPDGSVCATDEPGEVWARGALVMPGYWNRPEANAESFGPDGWFHTGDIGKLDADGYLYLVDRLKDMIVSKGENVYPAEVERVLYDHPDIADAAVIGIPDDEFGEAVCAVLVPAAGRRAPTAPELRAWGAGRLASYKLPRVVEVATELPRNPSGKVLRRELREPYWRGRDRRIN